MVVRHRFSSPLIRVTCSACTTGRFVRIVTSTGGRGRVDVKGTHRPSQIGLAGLVRGSLDIRKAGNPGNLDKDIRPAAEADQRVLDPYVLQPDFRQRQLAF